MTPNNYTFTNVKHLCTWGNKYLHEQCKALCHGFGNIKLPYTDSDHGFISPALSALNGRGSWKSRERVLLSEIFSSGDTRSWALELVLCNWIDYDPFWIPRDPASTGFTKDFWYFNILTLVCPASEGKTDNRKIKGNKFIKGWVQETCSYILMYDLAVVAHMW